LAVNVTLTDLCRDQNSFDERDDEICRLRLLRNAEMTKVETKELSGCPVWKLLLCDSADAEWAIDKVNEVLDLTAKQDFQRIFQKEEEGTGRRIIDLATPRMRQSLKQRSVY
jgi:hypothetical protein